MFGDAYGFLRLAVVLIFVKYTFDEHYIGTF